MKEFKGTPGPWVVDIRGGCVAVYPDGKQCETPGCHHDDKRNIAYSNKGAEYDEVVGYWSMDKKTISDYTLIAAAPDLLEALQLSLNAMNEMGDILNFHDLAEQSKVDELTPAFDKARAAISKALGEE